MTKNEKNTYRRRINESLELLLDEKKSTVKLENEIEYLKNKLIIR